MSNLCDADDAKVIDFLTRAQAALATSGFEFATLDLLDALAANPTAYGLGGRADLVALAAEFVAPFESEGVIYPADGETNPTTMRAAVARFLEAGDDGVLEFGFRTFATREDQHWNNAGTLLDGVPIYALYVICEGERTYCCSMTPSSWAIQFDTVICTPDESDDVARDGYGRTALERAREEAMENASPEDTYFSYFGDRDTLDKREADKGDVSRRVPFEFNVFSADLAKLTFGDPENDPAITVYKLASEELWESAREHFQSNAEHPRILFAA